jgi:hypothetical protein
MSRVFLTNVMLQTWAEEARARIDEASLTLVAEQRTFVLTPAVRFLQLVDGSSDVHRLLGKVKTNAQLIALGAERYMNSVIVGDVGYTVVEGYCGEQTSALMPVRSAAASASVTTGPSFMPSPAPRRESAIPSPAPGRPPSFVPESPSPTPTPTEHPAPLATASAEDAALLSALFLSTVPDR